MFRVKFKKVVFFIVVILKVYVREIEVEEEGGFSLK